MPLTDPREPGKGCGTCRHYTGAPPGEDWGTCRLAKRMRVKMLAAISTPAGHLPKKPSALTYPDMWRFLTPDHGKSCEAYRRAVRLTMAPSPQEET